MADKKTDKKTDKKAGKDSKPQKPTKNGK